MAKVTHDTDTSDATAQDPVQAAYQAGRIDALAGLLDERYRALANLDRVDAMSTSEIEKLITFATEVVAARQFNAVAASL